MSNASKIVHVLQKVIKIAGYDQDQNTLIASFERVSIILTEVNLVVQHPFQYHPIVYHLYI